MFHAVRCQYSLAFCCLVALLATGCGTTREHLATEQLVVSDAVDKSIQEMDFRPLSGRKVYLDTSYLRAVKGTGFVNAEYVIGSLRQQIVAAGCLIQDSSNEADVIIEARIGTLGSDNHLVTYGIPENNAFNSAARVIPNAPTIPTLPEIAFARREAREAAAKIAAFAYDRETRQPIWQSGIRHSVATAKDTWVLGVGPFQGGSIRKKTKLAGSPLSFGKRSQKGADPGLFERPAVDYTAETQFNQGWPDFSGFGYGSSLLVSDLGDANAEDEDSEVNSATSDPEAKVAEKPTAAKK